MSIAAFGKFTEAGIARRAAERLRAIPPPQSAPEPEIAPVEVPEAVSNVTRLVMPRDEKRRIIDLVARMHGTTYEKVMGRRAPRAHAVVGRQAAVCAIAQTYPMMTLHQLGRLFDRDHTTVLHALQKRGIK